ncbi:MAG: EFR1 family ferrodoxin [Clostridia bacterium]|nr:EFR1 family ferrodoxin [Clostridia bacterium]
MKTTLYVFSATGNSLTTATILSKKINAELVCVASTRALSEISENSDAVGFVFPVYYGNMPYPVREMITKMKFSQKPYIFTVATYRGHAGDVARRMDALLKTRGVTLSLSLGLPMPGNSFINKPETDRQYLAEQEANIEALLPALSAKEIRDYSADGAIKETPIDTANNFRGITAEDTCIGCGRCVRVCPMNNITLTNGKAVIGDRCATCLACFHWCPVEAIWMSKQENIARRSKYHHPDVTFEDIAGMKNK